MKTLTPRCAALYAVILIVTAALLSQCASAGPGRSARLRVSPEALEGEPPSIEHSSTGASWRPSSKGSIPVVMNESVKKWVNLFSGPMKSSFDRWVGRLGQYGPTIEHILRAEGVPTDLIYLAMIESGFNLKAYSRAAATGPWQFISSTGRMYGLCYDPFLDERRDIVKSTRAAARHLKDLHKIYADWYLAFAAYNAGSGKVNNAIKRSGSTNYWTIAAPRSRHLRQETKDYVPKILAALHIVKNYRKFGYSEKSFGPPMEYDRVKIPDATDVAVIAKCSGTATEVIRDLNPALLMGVTAPSREVEVFIPKGAKDEFNRKYAAVPTSERVAALSYTVGRKDTLASLARKFGTSSTKLAKTNNLSGKGKLTPGQVISVPATGTALVALAAGSATGSGGGNGGGKSILYHKVRRGETLPVIAHKYGTSATQLAKWNKIGTRSRLRIGQKLKIHKSGPATEEVGLAALPSAYRGKRMSGIAHIIALDEVAPANLEENDKIELPPMVAQNDDASMGGSGDEPANVRDELGLTAVSLGTAVPLGTAAITNAGLKSGGAAVLDEASNDAAGFLAQDDGRESDPRFVQPEVKTYTVKRRDSLIGIALKHRLKVSELKALNHLKDSRIQSGQRLIVSKVPSGTAVPSETAVPSGAVVPSGTKASTVSQTSSGMVTPKTALPPAKQTAKSQHALNAGLAALSQPPTFLAEDTTAAPELIQTTPLAIAKASGGPKVLFHRVKRGDTLWSLSQRYRVTIGEIKQWNGLKNNYVKLNQRLKIIAGATVATRKKYAVVD